ncbi:MAG TPA: peptidyl-prolyl cis-trans isomerase [Candidatus Hydrogenedentes bacterium]|nr:peptidyl-prolyl cis-trans isomerase [Candidatus Hydrogenedentota bacterium]HPJ98066.1 peptidyl-prolyl cis-trans isomerase [Candidatus Hydrogenedentota bacterium]
MSMLMRKYKKEILWVTIILIVGPFVVWGGYRSAHHADPDLESALAPVAVIDGSPISAAEYREALNQEVQQRRRFGQEAEFADLLADGSAQRVMEAMVSRRLLEVEAEKSPYSFDKDYLVEQLKDQFKDDQGRFDGEQFNQWVQMIDKRSGQSWNQIYAGVADQMRHGLVIAEIAASARVSEKELKSQFEDAHTKLDLKYAAIAPSIEPTAEEIQAQYDADPSVYDIPGKRKADFVALSLRPPVPAIAAELIQKARAGEDFAELAKAHSEGADAAEGGDMGWVVKTPQTPAFQEPLFALKPGEVSGVVEGPAGQYFIYKAEEERESAVLPDVRDIKARRIVLSPRLSPDENTALTEKAEALLAAAKESGDLAAAAAEAGCQVQTTDLFGPDSPAIASIPQEDVFRFRTGVSELAQGVFSNVISGQANLYVAKVVELTPAEPQPFEAVKDRVRDDAIETARRSPEYIEKCRALAEEIKGNVTVLAEIPEKHPDLQTEVVELDGFSQQDYMSLGGLAVNPRQLYALAKGKAPGDVFGPLQDFMGQTYLVQLVAKHPPTDADWEEKWPQEHDLLRDRALAMAQNQRLSDYLQYLRDTHPWGLVEKTFQGIFQTYDEETEAPAGKSAAPAPGGDDAPAADSGGETQP